MTPDRPAPADAEPSATPERERLREEVRRTLIDNRRTDHPISAYLFDPDVMADAILPILDRLTAEAAGKAQVAGATWPDAYAAGRRGVLARVRAIYDLQCGRPLKRSDYVDDGAFSAHRWWQTVLGGELERLEQDPR